MTTAIKDKLIQIAPELFAGTPVAFAYLYGSVARGDHHRFSDLDVAIFAEGLDRKASLDLELSLSLKIDSLLGHVIETEVRNLIFLPVVFQGEILTTGVLIFCGKEERRVTYETNTRMRYFDFLPVIQKYRRVYLGVESA